jgi:hypothetical protein
VEQSNRRTEEQMVDGRKWIEWVVVVALMACVGVVRDAAGQVAATEPGGVERSDVRVWLKGLADADPAVRETSRLGLMRMTSDELPALRDEIVAASPIGPAQAEALPDIVKHVHLKGVGYEVDPSGFLGLSWPPGMVPVMDQAGVLVDGRLPGFDAYGVLETGDVILGLGDPPVAIRTQADLTEPVRAMAPGTILSMKIRRGTEEMTVKVKVGSRPRVADDPTLIEQWESDRQSDAQAYWDKEFAPLMGHGGPVAGR